MDPLERFKLKIQFGPVNMSGHVKRVNMWADMLRISKMRLNLIQSRNLENWSSRETSRNEQKCQGSYKYKCKYRYKEQVQLQLQVQVQLQVQLQLQMQLQIQLQVQLQMQLEVQLQTKLQVQLHVQLQVQKNGFYKLILETEGLDRANLSIMLGSSFYFSALPVPCQERFRKCV